jgi:nucleoside-diphosphate-sugar epimerase
MKSAFMSEVFHALSTGEAIALPVSSAATMWLASVSAVAANLAHALVIPASGTLTLPALHLSMSELVAAIARAAQTDPALASYIPDPALEAGFGRLPQLATPAADALGFVHDGTLDALVERALAALADRHDGSDTIRKR